MFTGSFIRDEAIVYLELYLKYLCAIVYVLCIMFLLTMYSILVSFRDTDNSISFLQMFEIKIHGLSSDILNLNIFTLTKSKCACTDGWVTDERRPYIMTPLWSICIFKWSLKGPGVWILPTCKGMKWKWCSDNIGLYFLGRNVWPAALWNHLCGFGLKSPTTIPKSSPGFCVKAAQSG